MSNTHNNLWQAVKELEFLSAFFSWLFMLLTRLAEPLMLIATLYVVAETGVPVVASPVAHDLAIGVMITAPEVLLPGAFVVAAKAQEQQRRQARLLFVVCWLFVGLTLATLFDLFLLHLSGPGLAALMFARCAVAVAYSILMRVMSHGAKVAGLSTVFAPQLPDIPAVISQEISRMSAHFLPASELKTLQAFQAEIRAKLDQIARANQPQIRPTLCENFGTFPAYAPIPAIASGAASAGFALIEFSAKVEQKAVEELPGQSVKSGQESSAEPRKYFMTFEEAAQFTGYSISTLEKQLKAGKIEASANGEKLKISTLKIKSGTTGHLPALHLVNGRSA